MGWNGVLQQTGTEASTLAGTCVLSLDMHTDKRRVQYGYAQRDGHAHSGTNTKRFIGCAHTGMDTLRLQNRHAYPDIGRAHGLAHPGWTGSDTHRKAVCSLKNACGCQTGSSSANAPHPECRHKRGRAQGCTCGQHEEANVNMHNEASVDTQTRQCGPTRSEKQVQPLANTQGSAPDSPANWRCLGVRG